MEEREKKRKEIVISKSTYFNNKNKTNQIEVDKVAHEGRSLSFKKEDSKNDNKEIPKKTAIKKIHLSPESHTYQTQTFNSHTPLNSRLNFDSLSDKNGLRDIPISKEKKIYLYLTNNNMSNNQSDPSSIFETPKTVFRKPEENIEKLSLEEGNKEEMSDNFNRANIINNISNNNVNNIFVNFISSNIQTNLSRNIIKEQYNNSFDGKMLKNNILEDGLNKGSINKIAPKDSNTIFIRDRQAESKIMINRIINKDDGIKPDKLDYYTKIVNSANSFIFDKLSNNRLEDLKEQKIGQNYKLSLNKTINHEEKLTEIESNRFLKNYIKNKTKNLKNNKNINNLKRHNNSFSSAKVRDFSNNIFNHNNPIFINIISKNPFQEEIDEENEFDLTFSSKKSKKNEKKLKNSSTTKFLNSKYNNLKSPFIYSNRNNPNNIFQNYNISKNNLNNNIKKINSFYKNKNINSVSNYSSININDNISYKSINNCKKRLINKNNSKIISDSIIKSKEKNNIKLYSSEFNTMKNKINNQSTITNNNNINIDIIKKNKNINNKNKDNINSIVDNKNKNKINKKENTSNYNIINNNDINKNKNLQDNIKYDNIKKKSNIKKKKKRCAEIINNINELNNSINNINNKNKALYNNTNIIFIKSNKKNKKSQNNKKNYNNNKIFNETYNKSIKNSNNIIFISNRDNFKSYSTEKNNLINNNLNNKFDRNNKEYNIIDNKTERKSIKKSNLINPNNNIQNKNSVIKNINSDLNKKINFNTNTNNVNKSTKKNLSNLSTSIIDNLKTKETNKIIYKHLNTDKNSSTTSNNINDINNKTLTNSYLIKKNSFNTSNNIKNNKESNNLNSTINKKKENININIIINKNASTKNNPTSANINKINIFAKKDTNIKNNINNITKININKNMNNTTKNKNVINDINLIDDNDDLINSKNISSKNVIINNFNPTNNIVSFIDGNTEKKNNSNKKNNDFGQIYANNNKNINFIKAKNIISKNLTDNETINKIKKSSKIDKKDNKDNKDNKKDDIKNKNKIKKGFQNTFTNNINKINTFVKKEEKIDAIKNKNNSNIIQINYSNGVPKKIFDQKSNIVDKINNNKEKNFIEEINVLKNFNNNSSIVVSPTKGIIATNTLVYDEQNEEKGIFIHRLRGKSSLGDVPKKKCEICNNMIETHLFKIHLNSHPTEIFNWMYLGSYQNACDIKELRRLGINCVLNCASECLNNNLPEDIKELHLHIRDEEDFNLIPYFEEANIFINKARLLGENILIHCRFGISRSVSFIMAYLIKYFRFNVQGALNYVRRRRKQINPNQGFFDQLMEYEKYIKTIKK